MSDKLCFCSCHEHPGTYFCEPCSVCGHYHSRGLPHGHGRGWTSYNVDGAEVEELRQYLKQFESITGGLGNLTYQVREVIRHYATQAGRMEKQTGSWAPKP